MSKPLYYMTELNKLSYGELWTMYNKISSYICPVYEFTHEKRYTEYLKRPHIPLDDLDKIKTEIKRRLNEYI